MRQKPGPLRPPPTTDTPAPPVSRPASYDRPIDLDSRLPGRVRPDGSNEPPGINPDGPHGSSARVEPGITITQMSETQTLRTRIATSPLEPYLQSVDASLHHDVDGLKMHKGRRFADIANEDGSAAGLTVMVAFHDLIKAYRARLPSELTPSGPPLYRVADSNVWSLKKPIEYYDPMQFASSHTADAQGYYSVHKHRAIEHSGPYGKWTEFEVVQRDAGFAFADEHRRLIRVDPSEARGETAVPLKLAHWSDGDIWKMYRLEGAQALVFRIEAQALGKAPDWATRFNEPDTHTFLIDSSRWSYPQKSETERAQILRSYNLSMAQQNRLRQDMEHGRFPDWAEQHKRLSQNPLDDSRFEQIAEELEPFILKMRNEGENHDFDSHPVEQRYEENFLKSYLEHAGYKRNKHDYLYRIDIPAMFRADLRTPFELARDKRLVKLRGNPSDSTTKSAFSATFGAANALSYMGFDYYSNPRHYNSQANRYPGHFSDSDSSSGYRHNSAEESDTSFEMDDSRDYPLLRRKQTLGFLYVIDTRGIEVVPRVENIYLNDKDFDGDKLEGRISMPTRGISAERIWLASSDLSQAARVGDILRQAGDNAEQIEKATWAGTDGSDSYFFGTTAYDRLISQIAHSGGIVLKLPKGKNTHSNDITWPVAEHYRA
ncbi:hypothetical protein PS655_02631 [Pseudomonas fluorescens]|uniref:Uncharacterized protein n=2 Tax=Pseudomonas fluorescens TaxID=294 RepID=A0A5E6THC7_PSEFL|nr:hypothetical protein PS655_02631 [Pseudomonas fluorescens]